MRTTNNNTRMAKPAGMNVQVWRVLRKVADQIKTEELSGNGWKQRVMISCKEFYQLLLDNKGELILSNKELITFAQNGHINSWANEVLIEGINLLSHGEFESANSKFELYKSLLPASGDGFYFKAKVERKKLNYLTALNEVKEAIIREEKNARYFLLKAQILSDMDQDEKALKDLHFALLLEPMLHEALFLRALIYIANGEKNQAIQDLRKAISLKPNETRYSSELGRIFMGLRKLPEAYKYYRKVLSENPFDAEALFNCATIKIELQIEKKSAEEDLWMARSLGHPKAEELLINTFYPRWEVPFKRAA